MPPQVHVAVATRHDPPLSLARLRSRGHLSELRLADIRFTLDEASELLNQRLRLGLGADDLVRLHGQTEGWPAGIRMVASSLERIASRGERSSFIAGLSDRDRHLFDYLAAEVLDRQEPSLRSFLLETSILAELTPGLCRAVTGREDAGAVLEELDGRDLFVVAEGGPDPSRRYHALFGEFLQGRLRREMPDRVAELHLRAARAFTAPGRAISHYLAAGQWQEAARVIEGVALPLLRDGLFTTVANWLQAMPAEARLAHPRLVLFDGLCSFDRGDFISGRASLEAAVLALEKVSDEEGIGLALSHLATGAFLQADLAAASALAEHALSKPGLPAQRVQLLMTRCWVNIYKGAGAKASADLDAALAEGELSLETLVVMAHFIKADLVFLPGGAAHMARFLRLASRHLGKGVVPLSISSAELTAFLHFWHGRLDQALNASEWVVARVGQMGGYAHLGVDAAGVGAAVSMARGDYEAAERLLGVLHEVLLTSPMGQSLEVVGLYMLARLRFLQSDPAGVRHIAEETQAMANEAGASEHVVLRLRLQGLLALAEKRYAEAERSLTEAASLERQMPLASLFGTARVLLARLAYERDRPKAALAEIMPVLEQCQRENTPGLLLMDGREAIPVLRLAVRSNVQAAYARWLLSLLEPNAVHPRTTIPETGEVLSIREQEVLSLLVAGASNRAIAEKLVIGETTVKSHVSNILRKLNVSSRTAAVAKARGLGVPTNPGALAPA